MSEQKTCGEDALLQALVANCEWHLARQADQHQMHLQLEAPARHGALPNLEILLDELETVFAVKLAAMNTLILAVTASSAAAAAEHIPAAHKKRLRSQRGSDRDLRLELLMTGTNEYAFAEPKPKQRRQQQSSVELAILGPSQLLHVQLPSAAPTTAAVGEAACQDKHEQYQSCYVPLIETEFDGMFTDVPELVTSATAPCTAADLTGASCAATYGFCVPVIVGSPAAPERQSVDSPTSSGAQNNMMTSNTVSSSSSNNSKCDSNNSKQQQQHQHLYQSQCIDNFTAADVAAVLTAAAAAAAADLSAELPPCDKLPAASECQAVCPDSDPLLLLRHVMSQPLLPSLPGLTVSDLTKEYRELLRGLSDSLRQPVRHRQLLGSAATPMRPVLSTSIMAGQPVDRMRHMLLHHMKLYAQLQQSRPDLLGLLQLSDAMNNSSIDGSGCTDGSGCGNSSSRSHAHWVAQQLNLTQAQQQHITACMELGRKITKPITDELQQLQQQQECNVGMQQKQQQYILDLLLLQDAILEEQQQQQDDIPSDMLQQQQQEYNLLHLQQQQQQSLYDLQLHQQQQDRYELLQKKDAFLRVALSFLICSCLTWRQTATMYVVSAPVVPAPCLIGGEVEKMYVRAMQASEQQARDAAAAAAHWQV